MKIGKIKGTIYHSTLYQVKLWTFFKIGHINIIALFASDGDWSPTPAGVPHSWTYTQDMQNSDSAHTLRTRTDSAIRAVSLDIEVKFAWPELS